MNPERIGFVHVPKTGGSSLVQMFRVALGSESVRDIGISQQDEKYDAMLLHHHASASMFQSRFPDARLITFFRHPVGRLLSVWRQHQCPATSSVESLIQWAVEYAPDNKSFLLFGKSIEEALDVLENSFMFVGFFERFRHDVKRLFRILDFPKPFVIHKNWNLDTKPAFVPFRLRIELVRIMSDDIVFYDECLNRFCPR